MEPFDFEVGYPKNPPFNAAQYLIGCITGTNTVDKRIAGLAGYNIQGYAQGKLLGEPDGGVSVASVGDMTKEEAVATLQMIPEDPNAVVAAGAIPWAKLVKFVRVMLPLILEGLA